MCRNQSKKADQLLSELLKASDPAVCVRLEDEFTLLPRFVRHRLSKDDLPAILRGWESFFQEDREISFSDLRNAYAPLEWDNTRLLLQIQGLLDRNIISPVNPFEQDYREYPLQLLFAPYRLSSSFAFLVLDLDSAALIARSLPGKLDSYYDLKKAIAKTFELTREYHWEANAEPEECEHQTPTMCYLAFLEPIIDLMLACDSLSLVNYLKAADLSHEEFAIVIYLLYQLEYSVCILSKDELIRVINADHKDLSDYYHFFASDSKLLTNKILVECSDLNKAFTGHYRLSFEFRDTIKQPVVKKQRSGKKKARSIKTVLNELDQPALYLIPVRQNLSDLILPKKDMELLLAAINRFRSGSSSSLAEWGIYPPMDPIGQENKGLFMLLYGQPGTGKTYTAGAIAAELGKELVSIDATQLRDMWYGNAEKFVRRVFQDMRQLSLEAANPPIFLFNEADQLMHKRADEVTSIDATENAIQNIIMEEMENFPGIMIMTTNLVDSIDGAYFRRINIKLELTLPDYDCRLRLWKNHLLPSIPGADRIQVTTLAKDYAFTGGQISLVIQNACNEAIMRKGNQRVLTFQDLVKYARLEQPWGSDARRKPIGF